jgi:gas vesicle protein
MSETTRSRVSYLLIGLGVGSVLGVFFAPKSGKDTRKYLVQRAEEGAKYAQRKVRDLRERTGDFVEQGQKVATRQKEFISEAIDAGRDAYQRVMSKVV